jgi:hypothetical protein
MSFQPPDWSCFVDGKLVGLNFATAFYAKRNGVAFVLKQIAAREGRTIRLAEEEQATRPKLQSYQEQGQRVELFVTEKSGLFVAEGLDMYGGWGTSGIWDSESRESVDERISLYDKPIGSAGLGCW